MLRHYDKPSQETDQRDKNVNLRCPIVLIKQRIENMQELLSYLVERKTQKIDKIQEQCFINAESGAYDS